MATISSKEVAAGAFAEVYRQPLSGAKSLSVHLTNLLDGDQATNTVELLLIDTANVLLGATTVVTKGSGYQSVPAIRLTSAASQKPALAARMELDTASIASAGIYYKVNDVVTLQAGTGTTATTAKVTKVDARGRVTELAIVARGLFETLTADQRNVRVTGGAGRDLLLNATWRVASIVIVNGGLLFTDPPALEIDGNAVLRPSTSVNLRPEHRLSRQVMPKDDIMQIKDLEMIPGELLAVRAGAGAIAVRVMG